MAVETPQPNPEAFHELKNPDFNSGNLSIYFSTDPKGFEVVTDQSLPRKDGPLPLNEVQKTELKHAMEGELAFTKAIVARDALVRLRKGQEAKLDEAKITALNDTYESARSVFVNTRNKPKLGVRNIRREGNKLIFDDKAIAYPAFSRFSNKDAKPEVRNFAEVAANIGVLVTKDNKLVVVHRKESNELYPGMIGASVAANIDGVFDRPGDKDSKATKKGRLKKVDLAMLHEQLQAKTHAELGLDADDYTFTLTGFAEEIDSVANHAFVYTGTTKLTSNELSQKAEATETARKEQSHPNVEKRIYFIDATPEAVFTMLTEVKCPIGPDHAAPFVVWAYDTVLKRDGKVAADKFKKDLEEKMPINTQDMDRLIESGYNNDKTLQNQVPRRMIEPAVENYKKTHPNASNTELEAIIKEATNKAPKRNPKGFSPHYLPEEQGLDDFVSAFKKKGLIS